MRPWLTTTSIAPGHEQVVAALLDEVRAETRVEVNAQMRECPAEAGSLQKR